MSLFGLVLIVLGVYFALRVVGFMLKLGLWLVVLFGLYWLLSPYLGLPMPM